MEERIHKFYLNNRYIVLDIASGSVHVVEKIVYEMIDDYEKLSKDEVIDKYSKLYNEEDAKEAYEEIDYLAKEDLLFSEDEHFKLPRFNPQNVVKALCLHVAHDCNLRCKYCFASQGDFKGDRSLMTFETGKKALDFLLQNSGNRRNLEVDFFGGEPLMNFDLVKNL